MTKNRIKISHTVSAMHVNAFFVILISLVSIAGFADAATFGSGSNEFTMDFVSIGGAGNAAQSAANRDHDQSGGDTLGAVDHVYDIGTYQVTIDQFTKANAASGNSIGNGNEDHWQASRGVNAPAVEVNFYEAAKFCNWLTSGSATNGAYLFDGGGGFVGIDRDAAVSAYGRVYVLPTRNEWFKAAYYDIDNEKYTLYAFGVDSAPVDGMQANYRFDGEALYVPWAVGSGSMEQNGTYDMMGNVWELTETLRITGQRRIQGGSYHLDETYMESDYTTYFAETGEAYYTGFRVAAIQKEPADIIEVFGSGSNTFTMGFMTIEAAGNAAQSSVNRDHDQSGGDTFGAVGYEYAIGKHEVTIDQFFKANAASGYAIGSGNENYWQASRGVDAPATYVNFFEAARFCNWLTSGNATNGAYQFDGGGNFIGIDRAAATAAYGSAYVLPDRDEWAKAAYYNMDNAKYTLYAFGVDTTPVDGVEANYRLGTEPAAVWAVGSGAMEQNGTCDMMGNVWELNEASPSAGKRIILGGAYHLPETYMASDYSTYYLEAGEGGYVGFRVAIIPEPPPTTVNALFQDNMVLQRDMDVSIWGRALPGVEVTVKLDGVVVDTAIADSDGRWVAGIGSHADDGGASHTLSVTSPGEPDIQINEVVFGDVFLASGQSNMDMMMGTWLLEHPEELAVADSYPLIRQVAVARTYSTVEWEEPELRLNWSKCSSSSLSGFTAAGYFFAKTVYLETGVPVGLITCPWSGKQIDRFLCPSGVAAVPELAGLLQYQEQGGLSLYDIYNAMIAPLAPYGIRGAIWYQGESNVGDGDLYRFKMQALMRGWRRHWNQGNFPFYYVQLPNYSADTDWPGLREAQLRTLSETNSGMAVTIDIGEDLQVHPLNKYDVGRRLARWALARDFGRETVYSGPLYRDALEEGSQIRILFDHAETGLVAGWKDSTNPVVQTAGLLQNFEIAGSNKTFVSATAVIDKDTVLVSSPEIPAPAYVRYCCSSAPSGTNKLYNTAGLPASPFRTDHTYRLDVKFGTGSAEEVIPGAMVNITAAVPPAGKVFDRWIGAASEIDNLNSSSATVTMPAHALYLLATYRDESAPAYTLTVNNGAGDGSAQSGSILNIVADVPPAGQLFDHWSGDTQTVTDVYAASSTLRMPTNNATVTAVYRVIDSVGDGISDIWRALYFGGDGTTTSSQSAANADPDGDGASNLQEYKAGTSPTDDLSVFRLDGAFLGTNSILSFQSVEGRRYQLETTDNLVASEWTPLRYNIFGDGMRKQSSFVGGIALIGFYRLRLVTE